MPTWLPRVTRLRATLTDGQLAAGANQSSIDVEGPPLSFSCAVSHGLRQPLPLGFRGAQDHRAVTEINYVSILFMMGGDRPTP